MAPRPKTYGTRRFHAKPAGELVNGTIVGEPEPPLRRADVVSTRTRTGKDRILGTAQKEEKQHIPSQGLGKEDESASGTTVGGHVAPSGTLNVEGKSTIVSPAGVSHEDRRMSAQDMSPPDISTKEHASRRKSIRRLVNGSSTPESQNYVANAGCESTLVDHTSPSHPIESFHPNGSTENHQESPVGRDIGLNDIPSDLHCLAIWVAQLTSKHSNKGSLLAVYEPKQQVSSPQFGQNIEMSDALDNVEDGRMTRGKEKKRLQQLKRKEPANDLSGRFGARVGRTLRPKEAAPIEQRLKDNLNEELRQKLFGPSMTKNVSTNITERNACGKLLFNTLADMGNSANHNSAAVLKSALEERKDDAPFLSAFDILASSSEIMSFVNFLFSKDDAPESEASNADESRPSTGLETSGATTITEPSGLTSRAGTSISDTEGFSKATTINKVIENKRTEKRKRSQEVVQALESATTVLFQIQQGEAGTAYITPYASVSMISNSMGHRPLATCGNAYGPPYPGQSTYGIAYGPFVGANLNNYASPYADPAVTQPHNYASPYSYPVTQPPGDYASPYANHSVSNQASGSSLVGSSGENQTNKHDDCETHHMNKEVHTPHQDIIGVGGEARKGNDEAADPDISIANKEADNQGISNGEEEANETGDENIGQGISNATEVASNDVDLDGTDVDDANKKERSSADNEASSGGDLTDNQLTPAKTDDKIVTPPAENHKLFTGERLGDFTSTENIDWLLTMGNGGKIPRPSKKIRMSSQSGSPSSQTDAKIQTEVSKIINEIMLCRSWHSFPSGITKHFFYASAEGQRLAAELERLMPITKPVVNTIIPLAESQARLRFYQQLESRAIKEKRDLEINRYYGAPVKMQQWVPPPAAFPAAGFPVAGFPIPPSLPSNGPMPVQVVRRGNVIAAPPGGRNVEEEKKVETYGYPPMPGSRPGASQRGQKRKRAARH